MPRRRKPRFQTWRTFLATGKELVAIDFFVVPTVTFRILFAFLVLAHDRRRVVHVNVTEHSTASWTAQQIVEALPWETAPRHLLRHRDSVYGSQFQGRVRGMGIEEVVIAARSPGQSSYTERLISNIRRECLDHVIVIGEQHLRRLLEEYGRAENRSSERNGCRGVIGTGWRP